MSTESPLVLGVSHCSGCVLIPSSHAEKTNEIGSKDMTNKENVAILVVNKLVDGLPQWMQSAFVHLASHNLRPDWHTCIDAWV